MTSELPSSQLGTQEYWNSFYSNELKNFQDSKDEGEVWFGYNQMMKIIKWILSNDDIDENDPVLDIGCGNGVFLLELADEGFQQLYGLDYSPEGVQLAKNIAMDREMTIQYMQADFLDFSTIPVDMKFKICHDKGTYDAISLRPADSKLARQKYIETLKKLLVMDGLFIITSCNWTLDELRSHFEADFDFLEHIPAPTYTFGGQSGSTVSTAVFSFNK